MERMELQVMLAEAQCRNHQGIEHWLTFLADHDAALSLLTQLSPFLLLQADRSMPGMLLSCEVSEEHNILRCDQQKEHDCELAHLWTAHDGVSCQLQLEDFVSSCLQSSFF